MAASDPTPDERSRFERFRRWLTWAEDSEVSKRATELVAEWEATEPERDGLQQRLDQLRNEIAIADTPDRVAELDRRSKQLGDEVAALATRRGKLSDEIQQTTAQLDTIHAKRRHQVVRLAQIGLLVILVVGVGLVLFNGYSAKTAAKVHIEYYAAVAAISPVLLVAGFVELAVIRPPGGGWVILTFTVPLVGATAASLVALATHNSTPDELSVSIWGLIAALTSLLNFVWQHTSMRQRA